MSDSFNDYEKATVKSPEPKKHKVEAPLTPTPTAQTKTQSPTYSQGPAPSKGPSEQDVYDAWTNYYHKKNCEPRQRPDYNAPDEEKCPIDMGKIAIPPKDPTPGRVEYTTESKWPWYIVITLLVLCLGWLFYTTFIVGAGPVAATPAQQKVFSTMEVTIADLEETVHAKNATIASLTATVTSLKSQLAFANSAIKKMQLAYISIQEYYEQQMSANANYLVMLKYNLDKFYAAPYRTGEGSRQICFTTQENTQKCLSTKRPINENKPDSPIRDRVPIGGLK